MRRTPFVLALAASAAMTILPSLAAAQPYGEAPAYDQRAYQQQRDDYDLKVQRYNEDRAAYDLEQQHRQDDAARRYGARGYDSRYSGARRNPCADRSSDRTAAGGLIGALAGAAIGSNVAGRGSRTEGAVLGALAGGVVGASVANSSARCDRNGYYYSYNQTRAYREPADYNGQNSGRYDYRYYRSNGCRLVVAPAQWNGAEETRYARVCPDGYGRYRLTE